ncbi:hypothetical protein PS623_03146 [Pseudomonas fluorescens]|uniref:hypothetical protein n=1 Tax=Pseudomonas fluorescens TaxID=294 RepID=UPI0012428237|nr:hypothetical protein [Pseudomonas fluorescens]VVM98235.1 hypothetical protein PS623_03146 [Pseudomonas fluorescens]
MPDTTPRRAQPTTPDSSVKTLSVDPPTLLIGVFDQQVVNASWSAYAQRDAQRISEQIPYDRIVEGNVWRVGTLAVGVPRVHYGDHYISLTLPVAKDSQFTFRAELGRAVRRVHEILEVLPGADTTFTVKVPLANGYLRYKTIEGRVVRLQWSGQATFENSGGDYNWAALSEFYKTAARVNLYEVLPPVSPLLHDIKGSYTIRDDSMDLVLSSLSGEHAAVDETPASAPARAGDAGVLSFLSILFPEVLTGLPPVDRAWLANFCTPPASLRFTAGQLIPELLMYWAMYDVSSVAAPDHSQALAAPPLSITPRLRLVGAGDEKQALSLPPGAPSVQWSFEGRALGRLVNEQGQMFYYPPNSPSPAFVLEANNKTRHPVARRSDAGTLISADVIKATAGGQSATSTFVALHTTESHYIKAQLANNKVKLKVFYETWGGVVEVPDAQVRWTVISGNGSMSAAGVFTPHPSDPSPFTVLLAEDTQDQAQFHYWTSIVLPVPTLDAARFVELTNG